MTRVVVVLVVFAFTSAALAQSSQPTTAPSIESLVSQLSADDWSAREAAQNKLVAMGPRATEALKRASRESPDDEVRQRAQAALAQIEQDQLIGPSVITLHLRDASVRSAFAELSRQAQTNLQPMPAELWDLRTWPTVTIDVEGKPFWLALRDLCDATGVELRQWSEGLRLMQAAGGGAGGAGGGPGWGTGRSTVCGAFLVTLRQCTRTQSVEYTPTGENRSSDFSLTFQATAEPKLRVLRAAYVAKLEEATDDAANALVPPPPTDPNQPAADEGDQPLEAAFVPGPGGTWQFTARLAYPRATPIGKRIKLLRGGVNVLLQTRSQAVEFANVMSTPANQQARTAGALKLTLGGIKKLGERYEVTLSVARDRTLMPRDVDWQQVQQSLTDVRLLDDSGRAFVGSVLNPGGGGDDAADLTMSFVRDDATTAGQGGAALNLNQPPNLARPGPGANAAATSAEPSKLVWQVPIETKEITIPFEFRDVPLPE